MNRREAVLAFGGLPLSLYLGGCDLVARTSKPTVPMISPLVDVHCHLFNGSDLPSVRFIKIVVLHHYPRQGIQTLDIRDADALDGLIALLTAILGRTRAPKAIDEIAVLQGRSSAVAMNGRSNANESAVVGATADFLTQNQFAVAGDVSDNALRTIRRSIFAAAGLSGIGVSDAPLPSDEATALAQRAYRSDVDLGLILRWFALFTRYRYVLADQLWTDHARQGFPPLLLCPAAIDYDRWLGENVDGSPLPLQVDVMGALARRSSGPVIHGYVGFDPLRQVYFETGKYKDFDPLGLVRRAIRDEGFLGVKLYPPMGFRPIGNETAACQTYPEVVLGDLFPSPAQEPTSANCSPRPAAGSVALAKLLDRAMAKLFDTCVDEDASVIAHANRSNDAGPDYSQRGDPAHWIPVFLRWPRLRVCLAHFGHFSEVSAGTPVGAQLPDASWEWALGRYIKQAGDPPVFADVSYLTEVSGAEPASLEAYAAVLRRWLSEFDPECRHLMFGTDWTMLGLDRSYEGYTARLHTFFKDVMKFDRPRLDRLFFGNAGRFLGLRQDDKARARLLEFYARNKLSPSRLPLIAAA